ncbi:hypothetical protein BJY01DRAFT_202229 [Aspergillus pseudoustus]|uniref:Retrotransposon gag domain-containing protein n=1 Tax=Aspergillus pseudoustus TaxID=1810923 RepID=A0ABR4KZS6_9EURO
MISTFNQPHPSCKMDSWHRNVRLLRQIDEFLDVDSAQPHCVADFISLIDAVREGLNQIDEDLRIPDSQINLHFLTKLKSRPEWRDWAMAMLRDSRINTSNITHCMSFQTLGDLAVNQEWRILQERQTKRRSSSGGNEYISRLEEPPKPRALDQRDINTFVVQQMNLQRASRRLSQDSSRRFPGHTKRPSQEEINDYVVRQMRRDQEQAARARSHSQPERQSANLPHPRPATLRCTFCGDTYHQSTNCWRRWRVAAEAVQGTAAPKLADTRNQISVQPHIYLSGLSSF